MAPPNLQSCVCCLLAIAGSLISQAAARAQIQPAAPALPAQLGWVQFQVQRGRITAVHPRHGNTRVRAVENEMGDVRESFSLSVRGDVPSVHYELTDRVQRLIVDVANGDQVRIDRESRAKSAEGEFFFRQGAAGEITMGIGQGESRVEYSSGSLWRLLLQQPDVCRRHLAPILERLRPNWRLIEQARQIESALADAAVARASVSRRRLRELVEQLGARDFRERQAADRQLRSYGQGVISFFDELDRGELDGEQRLRIRRIRRSLTRPAEDTPLHVAARLVDDTSLWLTLLDDPDPERRSWAAGQLERIWERKLDFDPRADPSTRRAQIARLRTLAPN